jgi:hypothetical protein
MSKFPEDYLTATEARALFKALEGQLVNMRQDISMLAEWQATTSIDIQELKKSIVDVRNELRNEFKHDLKTEFAPLKDVLQTEIHSLKFRVTHLEAKALPA